MASPLPSPLSLQFFTARSELREVVFGAVCDFLFVYEISQEPLNRFPPNSQLRRVWSLTRTNLNVKVKGQGYQGQKTAFFQPSRQPACSAVYVWYNICSSGFPPFIVEENVVGYVAPFYGPTNNAER